MSRYYNQVRSEYQGAVVEAPAGAASAPIVPEVVPKAEPVQSESKAEGFLQCEKICIVADPPKPLILGDPKVFSHVEDSYRVLRTRLFRLMTSKELHSIVISSPVPAEGKTLTTINLGLTFAKLQDRKVLLVDADLRTRGLSQLFESHGFPGLNEILQGEATFESAVLATDVPNLSVVTAGQNFGGSPEAFAGERWKEFMNWVSKSFEVVLVDAPPILLMADFELITAGCDGAMLVVRALKTSRELLGNAVKHVDSKKFLGVVFNGSGPRNGYGYYGYGTHE
jgi:protein-tyrosine kinase